MGQTRITARASIPHPHAIHHIESPHSTIYNGYEQLSALLTGARRGIADDNVCEPECGELLFGQCRPSQRDVSHRDVPVYK